MAKKRYAKRKRVAEGLKRLKSGGKSGKYIEIARIAADKLVRSFESRYGIKLEYKMDDVRSLDRELEKNYESNTLTPEEIVWIGYYLGELLRRNVGGEYEFREDPGVLVIKCMDIVVFPILKIQKALHDKHPGALESYVFLFAKKVSDKKAERAKE